VQSSTACDGRNGGSGLRMAGRQEAVAWQEACTQARRVQHPEAPKGVWRWQ